MSQLLLFIGRRVHASLLVAFIASTSQAGRVPDLAGFAVGEELPAGTLINDNFGRPTFQLSAGNSEIVENFFITGSQEKVIDLNGTLEASPLGCEFIFSVLFSRETGTEAQYTSDFLEVNGEATSLSALISGGPQGTLGGWSYELRNPTAGEYVIEGFGFGVPLNSYSIGSGGSGLLVAQFVLCCLPEPSAVALLTFGLLSSAAGRRSTRSGRSH